MTEEELRKDYYADRPSEPYSDDDRPSDWANIAHYAEENLENAFKRIEELEKENAELRKVAEFQQSSNMSRHFENKKLKEGLAVGSTFNKALNSMNKSLEEERDKYRNMVFDKNEQLTKAKEIIKMLHSDCYSIAECEDTNLGLWEDDLAKAEQFLNNEVEK